MVQNNTREAPGSVTRLVALLSGRILLQPIGSPRSIVDLSLCAT